MYPFEYRDTWSWCYTLRSFALQPFQRGTQWRHHCPYGQCGTFRCVSNYSRRSGVECDLPIRFLLNPFDDKKYFTSHSWIFAHYPWGSVTSVNASAMGHEELRHQRALRATISHHVRKYFATWLRLRAHPLSSSWLCHKWGSRKTWCPAASRRGGQKHHFLVDFDPFQGGSKKVDFDPPGTPKSGSHLESGPMKPAKIYIV